MSRYVILRHDAPQGLHWDFMIETGELLRTWSLPRPPESGVDMLGRSLPDHRPMYLDYEGPISGGRGSVSRWDRGAYEILHESDTELTVQLTGEKLTGRATLEQSAADRRQWHFSYVE